MSALLQIAARITDFPTVDGVAVPAGIINGVPFDAGGVAVDLTSPITYYNQGIPFTTSGRLAAGQGAPSYFGVGGAGFTAAGRLAMDVLATTHYSSGIPYTAISGMSVTGLAPFLGVTITVQPTSLVVDEPDPAVFSLTAVSGDASPINYQWQEWNGSSWDDLVDGGAISGSTTNTLTINPTAFPGDAIYRCRCWNAQPGHTNSDSAALTVNSLDTFNVLTFDGVDQVKTFNNIDNVLTYDGVP